MHSKRALGTMIVAYFSYYPEFGSYPAGYLINSLFDRKFHSNT